MAAKYTFRACSLRTGRIGVELPLTGVTATVALDEPGDLQASLKLPAIVPDDPTREAKLDACRELLNATTPGVMSVLVIRDGMLLGEWIIWTRDLEQNPVPITGKQFRSYYDHVAVDGFGVLNNVDQMILAYLLAQNVAQQPTTPLMLVEAPAASGNVVPKAEYDTGSEYVGKIITELGDELNGFDWWVDTEFDNAATLPTVQRTTRFRNPGRGRRLQSRIDVPATREGQSGVKYGQLEDATRVATTVYMTGTGEGDAQLVARGRNNDLLQSYPPLHVIDSRSSYDVQSLLDAQANAVAAASRSPQVPTSILVRADGDLQLGSYSPGDLCPIFVEPRSTYPDGVTRDVRIVSYSIAPPERGGTEMVNVQIDTGDTLGINS